MHRVALRRDRAGGARWPRRDARDLLFLGGERSRICLRILQIFNLSRCIRGVFRAKIGIKGRNTVYGLERMRKGCYTPPRYWSFPLFLVIDVGNTNTVLGLYEEDRLVHHFRISTHRHATSDEYGTLVLSLLERRGIDPTQIEGSILASVVPPVNRAFEMACTRYFGHTPVVVGPGVRTGMPILMDQPAELGADRIVNAVAAWHRLQGPLVVVDFGTATTFDAVNVKGEYLGGAIAPGVEVSMDALFVRTAKLPRVELKQPGRVIGKNTVGALQSGLFFGYVGLVDEIVGRMRAELGGGARVLATGGLASLFSGVSRSIEEVDEFLTLDGLRILYGLNRTERASL